MEFSVLAALKFRKLDPAMRGRLAAKLRVISEDPGRHLTKLRSVDAYKLRVGDCRVILDVDWEEKVMFVLTLGHRGTVYR